MAKSYSKNDGKVKELYSQDVEEALCGAALINPGVLDLDVSPGDFYLERLGLIWKTARDLVRDGITPDNVTVADALKRAGKLDDIGGPAYLAELITRCPNAYNAAGYARSMKDWAVRRAVIRAGSRLVAGAHNLDGEFYEELQKTVNNLGEFFSATIDTSRSRKEFEFNAGKLRAAAIENGVTEPAYLPFLGLKGYLVQGWSHLIAGYPKAGKSELITRLCMEWEDHKVLYFSEEKRDTWELRLVGLPDKFHHVTLVLAMGMKPTEILDRIQRGDEDIIIIDTTRNLLEIRDESDNAEIARAMIPFVALCQRQGKALIFSQHERKGGGNYGEGVAGGHAFLGVVDIYLELLFDGDSTNRRKIKGNGRIVSVDELIYEQREDGLFYSLGSPAEVELSAVKDRTLEVLDDWLTVYEIRDAMGDPKPSRPQAQKALDELLESGFVERRRREATGRGQPPFEYRCSEFFSATGTLMGSRKEFEANDKPNGAIQNLEKRLAEVYERWQAGEDVEDEYNALNERYKALCESEAQQA